MSESESEAAILIRALPPRECSPNSRAHWSTKAWAASTLRQEAMKATFHESSDGVLAFADQYDPVRLDIEIAWCCGRRTLDDDNARASCKAIIDGISDVLWGGQDRHVTIGTVTQTRGAGTVTVRLKGASA